MAESSDVSAVKVFNYICGFGGIVELSHLLKQPSPLAKKATVFDVIVWFEIQKISDPEIRLALTKNQDGEPTGIRIDLKKQMCLKYATEESCKASKRCKFWHLCKEFIEGTCKGNCGRLHDFHDEDNKGKTMELGLEKKTSASLRSSVAGSFLQVCLMYLNNECGSNNCPYLHLCSSAVGATPCECALSHNFADRHNKSILEQYGFMPPRASKVGVVRCNTLIPKQQKPFEASKTLNKHAMPGRSRPGTQTHSKGKGEAVSLSGLVQTFGKTKLSAAALSTSQQDTGLSKVDPLPEKVFNFICGKGGLATLSDLLRHPSPLARKFPTPGQELDAKIWLQVQAQPAQGQKIIVVENQDGEIFGARVNSRKKMCLNYSNGSCKSHNTCQFWHVCKGYLEGNCQGDCGLSHDFHDDGNAKKTSKLGLEKHPSGTVRNIVANSLPQVCLMYLKNECSSCDCPYLHICPLPVQGNYCSCSLSHEFTDDHNMAILKQYDMVPQQTKLGIMQCNILIPKQQKSFGEGNIESASSSLSSAQAHLNMIGSPVPLMSLPTAQQHENILGSQSQESNKSSEKKKKRRRKPRQRNKQTNQQGSNADDLDEEGSDSVSDNEDIQDKPDLYSTSKFFVDRSKSSPATWQEDLTRQSVVQDQAKKEKATTPRKPPKNPRAQSNKGMMDFEQVSGGMDENEAAEGNLINLSDDLVDDWQGEDASVDDFWTVEDSVEPLSQVDEMFFDDMFSSNVPGSLSQDSTLSNSSDQTCSESHPQKSIANLVFQCICNEHNGQVPFTVISQRQDLFPPKEIIDVSAWFKENRNRFITIENKNGEIEAVRAYSSKARICFRYLMTKQGCKDPKCFRYHVCKHYLANGTCQFGKKCRFSHSHNLKSPHNRNITKQLRLNSFSEEQLRVLISASVPEVCLDYNKHAVRGCKRGFRCNCIHICKYFVMGHCQNGDDCPLTHQSSLKTPHTKLILDKYSLTKVPPRAVFSALLVHQLPLSGKMAAEQPETEKVTQRREVPCSPQYICLDFLLDHCGKEQLCDHCHYSAPYLWQYKDPSSDRGDTWKVFTQSENEAIEQQFCDVNVTAAEMDHIMIATPPTVLIDPGEGHVKINFDDMKVETGFGQLQLRRLSTKSAIMPTDHALSTQWVWYWLDEESKWWREYGTEPMDTIKQDKLELSFKRGDSIFRFKLRDEVQKLFFRKSPMYQQNMRPPVIKTRVRRRPVFRSISEIQKLQRPLELPIPLEPESPQSLGTSAPGRVPSQWTSVPESEEFIRVPLPTSSDQFKLAESLFRRSMSENKATIVLVERVQNPFMWEKYARKKEQMEKRARIKDSPVSEKLLFHGTDPQNVDSICEENIDWRAQDEDRAALFGQGAYFTEEAALSNLYCKQDSESFRYMCLAEVLVGSFAKGEPSMKRPPVKSESASTKKELYDSCVDNVEKPTIYVLFDSDQYYPSFLIKYKTKSKVVC